MNDDRFFLVVRTVAKRQVRRFVKGEIIPSLVFPTLFLAAFAGGLSVVSTRKDFGYPSYTSFIFVFVLFVGTAYSAVFSAIAFTADLEGRFFSRMILAVPRRVAILVGLVLAGLIEAVIVVVVLSGIGLAAGMKVKWNALDLAGLVALALLLNVAVSLWSLGIAFRLRSAQATPLILLPLFAVLFVTPVYVPRALLGGWLKDAARYNPLTPLLEAGRGLLIHEPERIAVAFGSAVALVAIFAVFALLGLRKAVSRP